MIADGVQHSWVRRPNTVKIVPGKLRVELIAQVANVIRCFRIDLLKMKPQRQCIRGRCGTWQGHIRE
jgi:hypothetical protein